ncbi:MAG TPA: DUF2795 domain-containing protein [Gammaproteobacteria bacterium]|nr:DUF2795 domain-containing protein [Gammaproteobacteria bacterium]
MGRNGKRRQQSPTEVARYLDGVDFPADRQALLRQARRQKADDEILQLLDQMPNRDYGSMADVMKGVGHLSRNA